MLKLGYDTATAFMISQQLQQTELEQDWTCQ